MTKLQALPNAVIFSPSGETLTEEEIVFFSEANPCGIILMGRSCTSEDQIRTLIHQVKMATGNESLLVLIDEEGGRVSRLRKLYGKTPAPGSFHETGGILDHASLIGERLHNLGINVCCAPVLDLCFDDTHKGVVGDRSFGSDVDHVIQMGNAFCDGLTGQCVMPVLKHIPGHGRAVVDSHESLPVVSTAFDVLNKTDFVPFRELKDKAPIAMVAHIRYTAIDDENPATMSPTVISTIRETIGFEGVLISDDIIMGALAPLTMAERSAGVFNAGLDIVLHCSGNLEEMRDIINNGNVPEINERVSAMINGFFE